MKNKNTIPTMTEQLQQELLDIIKEVTQGVGTSYNGDEDEIGCCSFCHETSYKPHEKWCIVTRAQEAISKETTELQLDKLICCDCGQEGVETFCPYADDVNNEKVPVILCDNCSHERAMDI